jgi:hypothetical protein
MKSDTDQGMIEKPFLSNPLQISGKDGKISSTQLIRLLLLLEILMKIELLYVQTPIYPA